MKTFTIYKVTSPTQKSYVGITSEDLEERKRKHLVKVKSGSNLPFKNALRKYGKEMRWEVLEKGTMKSCGACKKEKEYIDKLNTKVPKGYNLTDGGEGIWGFRFTKEMKKRMSEAHIGYKMPEEQKRKISIALKHSHHPIHEHGHSEKAKKKMSQSQKELYRDPEYRRRMKKIHQKINGKKIVDQNGNIYPSVREAARVLGLSAGNISNVLHGRYSQTGGYTFEFI